MTWPTVRDAIETVVGGVTGITGGAGKVLDYLPHETRPDAFTTRFQGTTTINAWFITREGYRELQQDTGFRVLLTHDVLIQGWYALTSTTTEATFQTLLDDLATALRLDTTIWAIQPEGRPIEVRVAPITHDRLGGALCHHAEVRFSVDEVAEVSS